MTDITTMLESLQESNFVI